MRTMLIMVTIGLFTSGAHAQPPISVYVTSVGAVNGFTDPNHDNADSVKDLRFHLRGRKNLTLTEDREHATIVLVIQNRETTPLKRDILGAVHSEAIVRVKCLAKGTETELSGSGAIYATAARDVAKQIDAWVKANRDKF